MYEITLKRFTAPRGANYTMGKLYLGMSYLCDTLEPKNRGLTETMCADEVRRAKVAGRTAIPAGRYEVQLCPSKKFSSSPVYKSLGGRLPLLLEVAGFSGIFIHCGNTAADTRGCILVGYSCAYGVLERSRAAYKMLMQSVFKPAERGKERVFITIA